MRRSVFHKKCAPKAKGAPASSNPLDIALQSQEETHTKKGALRRHCWCDWCGGLMTPGDGAVCESIVAMGQDYFEWEGEFLEGAA